MLTTMETDVTRYPHVTVFHDRCAGCEDCVVRCPPVALSMDVGRWIAKADDSLCVGCRQCVRTCPFSAIVVDGPLIVPDRAPVDLHLRPNPLGDRHELRDRLTWDTALAEAERCITCPDPTCIRGCPAHNDIPMFIAAIRDRDLTEAHRVLRQTSVLPDVCSRVCDWDAQCEGACTWTLAGGTAVAIGPLERFITDNQPIPDCVPGGGDADGLRVAIVGSGPAGLAAAWELIEQGAHVTMFERDDVPGGLPRWGIPEFSLPNEIVDRPWPMITRAGLDLHTGSEIGSDDLRRLQDDHDVVILAVGAPISIETPIPGADLPGVESATDFLQRTHAALQEGHTGELTDQSVVIVGGGNTALDVARMALRVGAASAIAVEWLDERYGHARRDQLEEALAEGVEVRFSTEFVTIEGDGRVERVVTATTTQPKAGDTPKTVKGSSRTIPADVVVFAVGYGLDPTWNSVATRSPFRPKAPELFDRRWMASGIFEAESSVGQHSYERHMALLEVSREPAERVWVIGDSLTGAATGTVVAAMAQGIWTARAIIHARSLATADQ